MPWATEEAQYRKVQPPNLDTTVFQQVQLLTIDLRYDSGLAVPVFITSFSESNRASGLSLTDINTTCGTSQQTKKWKKVIKTICFISLTLNQKKNLFLTFGTVNVIAKTMCSCEKVSCTIILSCKVPFLLVFVSQFSSIVCMFLQ